MANILIIEKDQDSQADLKKFLEDIETEKEIHFYNSLEALSAETFIMDLSLKDDKKIKKIDILILSLESLPNPEEDIKKIRKGLEAQDLNPDHPTRIVLVADEGAKVNLHSLAIEDFICRPYEKLLFLQKIEILLNLPENVSPSFLNMQPIKEKIELGKKSPVRGMSELSLEIENPVKVSPGAYIQIYGENFTSDGKLAKVLTRSYGSYKEEDHYICRFDYYGLKPDIVSQIRRNLALKKGEQYPLKRKDENEKDSVKVIIVDADKEDSSILKDYLETYLPRVDILIFPSYVSFLKSCFAKKEEAKEGSEGEEEKEIKTQVAIQGSSEITCFINKEFQTSSWQISEDASFLGKDLDALKSDTELLLNSIDERQKEAFQDFLNYIFEGNASKEKFALKSDEGVFSLVQIVAKPRENGADLQIVDLTKKEDFDFKNIGATSIRIERIDLFFMDAAFIKNLEVWTEGFEESIQKLKEKEMPKIILTSKKQDPHYVAMYRHPKFFDFLLKPIDRSLLAKKLLVSYTPFLYKVKSGEPKLGDIKLTKQDTRVMLATEVDMLSLSEFGISIRFNAPMVKNRFIHFYLRSFLGMKDISPTLARCYFAEEDEANKGKYICYFTFLGVTDEVFKQIRLWMRDYYIKNKEQA